jgi:hypothetical protein
MKVYFARSISQYGSKQDLRDIELLHTLGFEVADPSTPDNQERYTQEGMDWFLQMVTECDMLIFRAHPDGSIPAGVSAEIKEAMASNLFVLEMPNGIAKRTLSVDETREYLRNIGFR